MLYIDSGGLCGQMAVTSEEPAMIALVYKSKTPARLPTTGLRIT